MKLGVQETSCPGKPTSSPGVSSQVPWHLTYFPAQRGLTQDLIVQPQLPLWLAVLKKQMVDAGLSPRADGHPERDKARNQLLHSQRSTSTQAKLLPLVVSAPTCFSHSSQHRARARYRLSAVGCVCWSLGKEESSGAAEARRRG